MALRGTHFAAMLRSPEHREELKKRVEDAYRAADCRLDKAAQKMGVSPSAMRKAIEELDIDLVELRSRVGPSRVEMLKTEIAIARVKKISFREIARDLGLDVKYCRTLHREWMAEIAKEMQNERNDGTPRFVRGQAQRHNRRI